MRHPEAHMEQSIYIDSRDRNPLDCTALVACAIVHDAREINSFVY